MAACWSAPGAWAWAFALSSADAATAIRASASNASDSFFMSNSPLSCGEGVGQSGGHSAPGGLARSNASQWKASERSEKNDGGAPEGAPTPGKEVGGELAQPRDLCRTN